MIKLLTFGYYQKINREIADDESVGWVMKLNCPNVE
jgi:hypothetical protein